MGLIEQEKYEKEKIQLDISNIFLDVKMLKFSFFDIIYDDCNIKINFKSSLMDKKEENIQDLNDILSKTSDIECSKCEKEITTYDFFIKKENKEIFICNDCYNNIKVSNGNEEFISIDKYISTCDKHGQNYELYCLNCKMNICPQCKDEHQKLGTKHEFIIYTKSFDEKEIEEKTEICKKVQYLCEAIKNISLIKTIENKSKEGKRFLNISKRLSRENKFAEIIISTFSYFYSKKALCYELISNFNDIIFNKALLDIDIKQILDKINDIEESYFHIIMQSPDVLEKNKVKIIPLCNMKKINSEYSLDSEIRGLIELKGGYYLAASKGGNICIFDSEKLEIKQKLRLEGISKIFHLEKIKDNNLDLIAVASNLNEIILLSVFKNNNSGKNGDTFDYLIECRKQEHKGKLNRIIQLSNGLIVSSAEDEFIIFWQLIKKDNTFSLQSLTKVKIDMDVHILIECPYTNELICNYETIDLKSFTLKRSLNLDLQGKDFNCSTCLFKEKYIASVLECDVIKVLNIENDKEYYIHAKYDYVEAVYTIDNESFCLCTQDLYNIFRGRYSQQYKLEEDDFVEVGKITVTGICNCYMTDSKNNFVMGDMNGRLTKFLV